MLNKTLRAEVLSTQMTMRVRLESGEILHVAGNAPKGSVVGLKATGVNRDHNLMGYEGYDVLQPTDIARKPKKRRFEDHADAQTLFSGPFELQEVVL